MHELNRWLRNGSYNICYIKIIFSITYKLSTVLYLYIK